METPMFFEQNPDVFWRINEIALQFPYLRYFVQRLQLLFVASIAEVERMHATFNAIKTTRRVAMRPTTMKMITLTKLNLPDKLTSSDLMQCVCLAKKLGYMSDRPSHPRRRDKKKRQRRKLTAPPSVPQSAPWGDSVHFFPHVCSSSSSRLFLTIFIVINLLPFFFFGLVWGVKYPISCLRFQREGIGDTEGGTQKAVRWVLCLHSSL